MGRRLVSLKGRMPSWAGKTLLTTNDRGRRGFSKMENCYVSADGQEIRAMPGYGTLIDLSTANNVNGYGRYVVDAVRPIATNDALSTPYVVEFDETDDSTIQTMVVRALPACYFGFEQVGEETLIFGETRFREAPIYSAARAHLTPYLISGVTAGFWGITLSGVAGAYTATDAGGASLNGLAPGDVIYVEGLTVDDEDDQASIDTYINGLMHQVTAINTISGRSLLTLKTGVSVTTGPILVTGGSVHKVRPNRSETYPSTGIDPYTSTYHDRPDDHNALTVWRITSKPDMLLEVGLGNNPTSVTAFVANRQRDFGDDPNDFYEGVAVFDSGSPQGNRGCSRREQRRLPYRPNVDCALDRVVLAAPQYGCMFQIPGVVPVDTSNWPSPQVDESLGVWSSGNNKFDKPRALGIPKGRLVESTTTPASGSPSDDDFNVAAVAVNADTSNGLVDGEYKFAISYSDSSSGEEGLASEPVYVTIPANAYAYSLRIAYIHPGYLMPECLADRINVYIAPPGSEAMAFYCSVAFRSNDEAPPFTQNGFSGVYGFEPVTPADRKAIYGSFVLPLINEMADGNLEPYLNPQRLAPQSATMPRGAEACRYIRGVLFAGGALGNAGPAGQLWAAKATGVYNSDGYYEPNTLRIRAHALDSATVNASSATDGNAQDGTLGIAGRCFPDAYQGISLISRDVAPGIDNFHFVDRVLNRTITTFSIMSSGQRIWHQERLRTERPIFARTRHPSASPGYATTWVSEGADVYYVMPRGQLQIGDPGAPWRSSRAFIKVIDPNRGDDISAIGHIGGSAIVCTRRETYSYSWARNPGAEEPNLMSTEFGCIAGNSMVEFDGGLAWLSERGPVAIGQGLQHIGKDVAEDFYGVAAAYARDSRGMMRHSWGCHDAQRGLIYWGLIKTGSSQRFVYEGVTHTYSSANDEVKSRFPCDVVLIWSYRANAFSVWYPPSGLEVLWMRPMRQSDGSTRTCFLAADGRIYAMEDIWNDANSVIASTPNAASVLTVSPTGKGSGTTLSFTGLNTFQDGDTGYGQQRNLALVLREGMLVEFLDRNGNLTAQTTIASVTATSEAGTSTIELSASQTWLGPGDGQRIRIGGRQVMKLLTNYIGMETPDTSTVDHVQLRYTTVGAGYANAKVRLVKAEDGSIDGEDLRLVSMTKDGVWEPLGRPAEGEAYSSEITSLGRRKNFGNGRPSAPEIALLMEITGEAQVRIQDISLEIG